MVLFDEFERGCVGQAVRGQPHVCLEGGGGKVGTLNNTVHRLTIRPVSVLLIVSQLTMHPIRNQVW